MILTLTQSSLKISTFILRYSGLLVGPQFWHYFITWSNSFILRIFGKKLNFLLPHRQVSSETSPMPGWRLCCVAFLIELCYHFFRMLFCLLCFFLYLCLTALIFVKFAIILLASFNSCPLIQICLSSLTQPPSSLSLNINHVNASPA